MDKYSLCEWEGLMRGYLDKSSNSGRVCVDKLVSRLMGRARDVIRIWLCNSHREYLSVPSPLKKGVSSLSDLRTGFNLEASIKYHPCRECSAERAGETDWILLKRLAD